MALVTCSMRLNRPIYHTVHNCRSRALIDAKLTLTRALMRIDDWLKQIGFPQVFTELRDFNVFNAYNTMGRFVTLVDLSGYLFSRENITVPTKVQPM